MKKFKFNSKNGVIVGLIFVVIVTIIMTIGLYPSYIKNEENKQVVNARTSLIICKRIISKMQEENIDFDVIDNTVNINRVDNYSQEYRNQFEIDLGDLYNKNIIIKVDFSDNNIVLFSYEIRNKGVSIDSNGNINVYVK